MQPLLNQNADDRETKFSERTLIIQIHHCLENCPLLLVPMLLVLLATEHVGVRRDRLWRVMAVPECAFISISIAEEENP